MSDEPPSTRAALRASARQLLAATLKASNRLRLPGPSVLPVAGAIVGLYSGLAAGVFYNLILLVRGVTSTASQLIHPLHTVAQLRSLWEALARANWHVEYAIIAAPLAFGTLGLSRIIEPGGPRDEVKRRLRLLALLTLGALSLYYPLVALAAVNTLFRHPRGLIGTLEALPWWVMLLAPALGGYAVGHLLRHHPETHGHGVPEVVRAVKRGEELPAPRGLRKLLASAITIGSGGSAGREGPIVYGGASFASTVGRTLGFSRKELSILMACGAGAGISASFNTPIAGAVFAMEIILREFELRVFSPIILASVAGTLVSQGVLGQEAILPRVNYQLMSGHEVLLYVVLGLLCGLLAFCFIQLLHGVEHFFAGRSQGQLSAWLGVRPLPLRAALGGLCAGLLTFLSPSVWGSGIAFLPPAALGQLSLLFLASACLLKLVATALTIGSGGSGGTFFPAAVIGIMAGGAFGAGAHLLFPASTASSGAYAIVGMGATVAALTRGPLTGMMMVYELSGTHAIILPLMVTCSIASALCHYLSERKAPKLQSDTELLSSTPVRALMLEVAPVPAHLHLRPLMDLLLAAEGGTLPVLDAEAQVYGTVEVEQLREVWHDDALNAMLVASDVARKLPVLLPTLSLAQALLALDAEDVDALPVALAPGSPTCGLVTRSAIRRLLHAHHARQVALGETAVAPTETRLLG
jgi:CIC family chloride channel protein